MENSDAILIHEHYQLEALKSYYEGREFLERVHVVPHGSREVTPEEKAKERIGISEDTKIVLMIGYLRPSKGFERIIRLWPRIVEKHVVNDISLIVAGKVRGIEYRDYRNMLYDEISSSPVKDTIKVIRGQISQESFDTIIAASDIVALPYSISSQSGIVAHCLAFGKPVVTSNTAVMTSLVEKTRAGLVCDTDDDYVNNIDRLLSDDNLRKEYSQNALRYVRENISWSKIAQRHIDIYEKIVEPSVLGVNTVWMD